MTEFDVTLCKFYKNEICYNEECPVKYCDGYQCIYKEISLLREHCKFIDETNKILNEQKESLLKENEKLRKQYNCYACGNCNSKEDYINLEKHHIELRKQYDKYSQCFDEIEEIAKDFHLSLIIFHKGATHEMADRIDYYLDKIKQLIKQTKEGE